MPVPHYDPGLFLEGRHIKILDPFRGWDCSQDHAQASWDKFSPSRWEDFLGSNIFPLQRSSCEAFCHIVSQPEELIERAWNLSHGIDCCMFIIFLECVQTVEKKNGYKKIYLESKPTFLKYQASRSVIIWWRRVKVLTVQDRTCRLFP